MDSFLFSGDYAKQITADNLQQLIGGNQAILDSIQRAAVEECISYLKQKYDTDKEFENTTQYDPTKTYLAEATVYLNAPAYDATKIYALGVQVLQAGNIYKCTTAITAPEAFTLVHWALLGAQWELHYTQLPKDMFNYQKIYAVGSQVFWKDKIYTCVIATRILDHEAMLQIGSSGTSSILNVFPDDPVDGTQYWGAGTAYSIAPGLIADTSKWSLGDNRDQKLLMTCIDIALYHLHSRIAPRNIPEHRVIRYMGNETDREVRNQRILFPTYCALGWLQSASIGNDITPELPLLQPKQGMRIRHGGNIKLQNQY